MGGGTVTRGPELDLCGGSQKHLGPWREGLSAGRWNQRGGEGRLGDSSHIRERKGKKYSGFFLPSILLPKPSQSPLASECGKRRGGEGMDQVTNRQMTSTQTSGWQRVVASFVLIGGHCSLRDSSGATEEASPEGPRSPKCRTHPAFPSCARGPVGVRLLCSSGPWEAQ